MLIDRSGPSPQDLLKTRLAVLIRLLQIIRLLLQVGHLRLEIVGLRREPVLYIRNRSADKPED